MSYAKDIVRARPCVHGNFMPSPASGGESSCTTGHAGKSAAWLVQLAVALGFLLASSAFAASNALSFGVFPQLSTRSLVETYQPLVDYLARATGQPFNLESAKDFYTFHTRTMAREYGVVLTAPHLAWLAWKEGGYRPILVYKTPAKGFIVVRADSPYRRLSDLRGATIATPDPLAIINLRFERDLVDAGLSLEKDVKLVAVGSHTNAATHVSERQADAAIVGVFPFQGLPSEVRRELRIIASTPELPSHVFLLHPGMTKAQQQAIKDAIEKFMHGEEGAAFLRKTGFGGVRTLKKNELNRVEGDAEQFKRRYQAWEQSAGRPE